MDWENMPRSRWAIRQSGAALLFVAYAAGSHLFAIGAKHHDDQSLVACLLALVAFLSGSMGFVLLILGHHVFDKIEVSQRWRRPLPAAPDHAPSAAPEDHASPIEAVELTEGSYGPWPEAPGPKTTRAFETL